MGLLDILRGVADQADFVPGFDPVKNRQGLLSQLLNNNGQNYQPKLDRFLDTAEQRFAQPGTMQPANAVQKNPLMMAAPGGPRAAPTKPRAALPMARPVPGDFKTKTNFIDFLNPFKNTAQILQDDKARYLDAHNRYTAQQAAAAAQKDYERNYERLYNQAAAMNLDPQQTTAFINAGLSNPEKLGENLAQQFKPRSIGEGVTERIAGQSDFYQPKTPTPLDPEDARLREQNANAATLEAQAAMLRAQHPSAGVTVVAGNMGGAPTSISQIPNGQLVPTDLLGGYKPDTGFMAVRNSEAPGGFELVPFEGGKVARADENRELRAGRTGGTVVQDINRALEIESTDGLAGEMAVGPFAGLTKVIPGTPAHRVDNLVQSALSNIGIDQLQAMRDASPTGGALGQVPIDQQKRLEQMLGDLQVQQVDEDWRNNAKRAVNIYLDIIHGPGNGPARYDLDFDYMGRPLGARPDGVTTDEWFNMDPEDRALFE